MAVFRTTKRGEIATKIRKIYLDEQIFSDEISKELCKVFLDDWKIISEYDGKPSYIESDATFIEGWIKDKKGFRPINPSKRWKAGFPLNHDSISKVVCGEKVIILLDKETLCRGFIVEDLKNGAYLLSCDDRLLKYITVNEELEML